MKSRLHQEANGESPLPDRLAAVTSRAHLVPGTLRTPS